jgi:lysine-N-methylase
MSYLRRPTYYRHFKCIASACTDSCCTGWEIDIDDETLEKYRAVKGDFGERLWSRIEIPEGDDGEPAHFRLTECDRCPFLNERNLCDIYTNLGEDYLGYICTHHPRFYEWYVDGKEAGLGLVCEAAAELILEKTGYPEFEVITDEAEADPEEAADEDLQMERETEEMLFAMRDQLFRIVKPETGTQQDEPTDTQEKHCFDRRTDELWQAAERLQKEYDVFIFQEEEDALGEDDISPEENAAGALWSDTFWTEDYLTGLLDFYLGLEINAPQWKELLLDLCSCLPELLKQREAFLQAYADHVYEYEQLLIYFLYRYFMKSRYDDDLCGKISFALISTGMIQLVDLYCWLRKGELSRKDQIDICKMYAKEIEYDEENVEEISHFMI